jgi:hypothetical protein
MENLILSHSNLNLHFHFHCSHETTSATEVDDSMYRRKKGKELIPFIERGAV